MAVSQSVQRTRITEYLGGGAGNEGEDIILLLQDEKGQSMELVMDHLLISQLIHELPKLAGTAHEQRKGRKP